ncbi:MAG TPA: PAS domain-containing protein, partial [Sphingomonas sp.]
MARIRFLHASTRDEFRPADEKRGILGKRPPPTGRQTDPNGPRHNTAEALSLLQNFEESCQGWFWSTDTAGRLTYLTENISRQLCDTPERVIGSFFTDHFVRADEGAGISRTLPFIMTRHSSFEKITLKATNSHDERWWVVSGCAQFDNIGKFTGYRGSGVDITEQRRSSEHASQLAMYDSLTGLPNRLCMSRALGANLMALRQQRRPSAVLL